MERFRATLAEAGRGSGRWVELPFDARERFGHERPPVRGTVNGTPFRLRLFIYDGITYLGLPHEIREAAGIDAGDPVVIDLELDRDLREAEVPPLLEDALAADAAARQAFDGLASTHRREYAEWIWAAAPDETRERRVKEALGMLRQGVKNP